MNNDRNGGGVAIESTPLLAKAHVDKLCFECKQPMSSGRAEHFSYCEQCVREAVETIITHTRRLERMANARIHGRGRSDSE